MPPFEKLRAPYSTVQSQVEYKEFSTKRPDPEETKRSLALLPPMPAGDRVSGVVKGQPQVGVGISPHGFYQFRDETLTTNMSPYQMAQRPIQY